MRCFFHSPLPPIAPTVLFFSFPPSSCLFVVFVVLLAPTPCPSHNTRRANPTARQLWRLCLKWEAEPAGNATKRRVPSLDASEHGSDVVIVFATTPSCPSELRGLPRCLIVQGGGMQRTGRVAWRARAANLPFLHWTTGRCKHDWPWQAIKLVRGARKGHGLGVCPTCQWQPLEAESQGGHRAVR
jgi:hypothetical protein